MSTPNDPAGDASQPTPPPSDAPTQAYPDIAADAPTQAYPPAEPAAPPVPPAPVDGQPAAPAYAPAPQAPYGQPEYAQPAYAAAPGPSAPDTRPKTLAWVSLGLAVLGVILACVGFVPVPWIGLISVVIGGLLLLVAFVLSIVALASRKQGGKPLSIIALVVAVLGGGLWAVALFVSIALTAITSSSSAGEVPAPSETSSVAPGDTDGDETEGETPAGEYDEAAFLAEARPAILAVFQDIDPAASQEVVDQLFPDDALIAAGQSMLLLGDSGRDAMIESLTAGGDSGFDDESAARFVDAIYDAAQAHLQE